MDDDTNYTTLAAVWILKKYGRDFKPVNVVDSMAGEHAQNVLLYSGAGCVPKCGYRYCAA